MYYTVNKWLDLHSFSCVLIELENTGYFIHVVSEFFSGGTQQCTLLASSDLRAEY